jgi:hypothetical protein
MRRVKLKRKIMKEAEQLLEKFARKNMIQWNQESFKKTHTKLQKSIIEAINEALRIHDVSGRSEQLFCHEHKPQVKYDWQKDRCLVCAKDLKAK